MGLEVGEDFANSASAMGLAASGFITGRYICTKSIHDFPQ
jgi:hypothetical protein